MEDKETLEGVAVVCPSELEPCYVLQNCQRQPTGDLADAIKDVLGHLLADSVVTTGVVVGSILLAADQELGVEKLTVGAGTDLVDGRRVKIDEEGARDIFAVARLGEEGIIGPALAGNGRVGVLATILSKTVLKEVARERADVLEKAMPKEHSGVFCELTAPRRCYQAGYRPGPSGCEQPV